MTLIMSLVTAMTIMATEAPVKTINATTDDGKKVVLYDNGKWDYASGSKEFIIKSTGTVFTKPATATKEIKGKRANYSVWIDPAKWAVMKTPLSEDAELSFSHNNGDAYAIVIAERAIIPTEGLANIVLQNAQSAAPNAKIIKSEDRIVNGKKVKFVAITGTIQEINFVYNYYLYSDSNGTMQVLCFTTDNLFEEYQGDFNDFLNGFVVSNK